MRKTIAAIALIGGTLVASVGTASASTASPAPTGVVQPANTSGCTLHWHDSNTVGVECSWGPFAAVAKCANGKTITGATAHAGTVSYAYCTSVNSHWAGGSNWWGAHV